MKTEIKGTKIDLRLERNLAAAAKKKARAEHRPLSQVMRDLLRAWVAGNKLG